MADGHGLCNSNGKGSDLAQNTYQRRIKFTENRKVVLYLFIWFPVFYTEWGSIHISHMILSPQFNHCVCVWFWPISGPCRKTRARVFWPMSSLAEGKWRQAVSLVVVVDCASLWRCSTPVYHCDLEMYSCCDILGQGLHVFLLLLYTPCDRQFI